MKKKQNISLKYVNKFQAMDALRNLKKSNYLMIFKYFQNFKDIFQ